jgi:vacuolar protein sorting-associated protein 54
MSTGFCPQENMTQVVDLSSLLEQAADKAQSEISKVLRVRTEQTINLGLADFLSYFTLNRWFINECEAVTGHPGLTLKNVIDDHFHKFVTLLHEVERQRLAQQMESEKWERVDFKPEDAAILARILQSMTSNPQAWLGYGTAGIVDLRRDESSSQAQQVSRDPAITTTHNRKDMVLAAIEQENFMIIDSAAFALRGIEQYAILMASAPSMVHVISTALLDYLKLFNSRTQQLILGAGAKLTAGLTTINAKHLALASQSLSLCIALMPYLRGYVRRRANMPSDGMAEYDRLERVFQEHQSFIYNKLIDIMSSRAAACIRAIEKVQWDDTYEVQNDVSPSVETLATEALTLKRVLTKFLPGASVTMITGRMFVDYRERFGKTFDMAVVQTEAGQAR